MLLDTSPNFLNFCANLFVASKRVGGKKQDAVPVREGLNIDRLTSFVITSQIPSQAMTRNSQSRFISRTSTSGYAGHPEVKPAREQIMEDIYMLEH